jgi:hypothetical protein
MELNAVWGTVITAIAVGLLSLIGNIYGSRMSAKMMEKLMSYRIDQLEKKMDTHNNLIVRMFTAEKGLGVLDEKEKQSDRRITKLEDQ